MVSHYDALDGALSRRKGVPAFPSRLARAPECLWLESSMCAGRKSDRDESHVDCQRLRFLLERPK